LRLSLLRAFGALWPVSDVLEDLYNHPTGAPAEALDVSQRTISTDLAGLEAPSKPSRPKGSGKKAGPKSRRRKNASITEETAAHPLLG
jgi:hypothetical protein